MKKAVLLIALLAILGISGAVSGASAQFDGLIGLTASQLHQRLGDPDYIRVYDYGLGDRYTYFTPEEWQLLQNAAPLTPGDDVYMQTVGNNTLQYHVAYTPVYLGEDKRQPTLYVQEYTVYTNTPIRLADLPKSMPTVSSVLQQVVDAQLHVNMPPYLPTLVMQVPGNQPELAKLFRRFRQRGDVNVQVEIGLQNLSDAAALGPDITVGYVVVRAGVLDKTGATTIPLEGVFN